MAEWAGRTALITGASYGLGEAFARRLAADGAHLILTARSRERMESLAQELRERHRVNITIITADLAQPIAAEEIFRETTRLKLPVDLLINNAGFGAVGNFSRLPLTRQLEMIQVNVSALVTLSHLYLPEMIERRAGAILNVASTAAFQAVPYFAIYAATKAFVLSFSEALWAESQPHGVRVLALCPGPTATNFQQVAGTAARRAPEKMQTAEEVVSVGLKALAQGRSHVVSGFGNRVQTEVERFLPRDVVTRIVTRVFRRFSTQ